MALLAVLAALACAAGGHAYRIRGDEDAPVFVPFEEGFVGRYGDPTTLQRERTNEGAPSSPTYSRDLESVHARQNCTAMVGPIDSRYYCHGPEYGYCDRRSGSCLCKTGYQGVDCFDCDPTHFRLGDLCYPKLLCPGDCSGAGECDYSTGTCLCEAHRAGDDCGTLRCSTWDPLCATCDDAQCLTCVQGFSWHRNGTCEACTRFDPRCTDCDADRCLACGDPLLSSVRRSGRRDDVDSALPGDELRRELTREVPFASQRADVFVDAEPFWLVGHTNLSLPTRCQQGRRLDAGWDCEAVLDQSHVVCGHLGSFGFSSPTYTTWEDQPFLPITVRRTGGGVGDVDVEYSLRHISTTPSDVKPTAHYTTSQRLRFEHGVVERTFFVQILEDTEMEDTEEFELRLLEPSGEAVLGPQHRAVVKITANDGNQTSAANSYAWGPGLTFGTAARESTFLVQTSQADGLAATAAADRLTAQLFADGDRLVARGSVAGGNGTYNCSLWPDEARDDLELHVELATADGLLGEYFDDAWMEGDPAFARVDPVLNFSWGTGRLTEFGTDNVAVRWTGKLLADHSELYTFSAAVDGDARARLWVDRHLVFSSWDFPTGQVEVAGQHWMQAGRLHDIKVEYRERFDDAQMMLRWESGSTARALVPQSHLFQAHHIHSSPFPFTVVSDVTNATNTFVTGKGLMLATAGEPASFTIHPRDRANNARNSTTRLDWFAARLELDGSTVMGSPELTYDDASQTWQGQYTPTKAGSYELNVWLVTATDSGDEYAHVQGSPFAVEVSTTYTLPARSRRWIREVGRVGDPFVMTVELYDVYDNVQSHGGEDVQMVMRHTTAEVAVYGEVTDYRNATYLGVAYPTVAGSYEVTMVVNGLVAGYGPVRANFTHIDAHAANCKAFGDGLSAATSSVPARFVVHTYDVYGNPLAEGFELLQAILDSDANEEGDVVDYLNGTYMVAYTPEKAGAVRLNVTVGGEHVHGSPFAVEVSPGAPDGGESTAEGAGLYHAEAGQTRVVTVVVRDEHGNDKETDDADLFVELVHGDTAETYEGLWAKYRGGAVYEVAYRINVTGDYLLTIEVDGADIAGSPFDVYVSPAAADEDESALTAGRGLVGGFVGNEFEIVLTSRDFYGNLLTSGEAGWTLWLTAGDGDDTIVSSERESAGNGTFLFYFTPTVAATYAVHCTLDRPGGLRAEYFAATDLTMLASDVVDASVDFDWGLHSPMADWGVPEDYFSVRWSGFVVAEHDEEYDFHVPADGGVRLYVDGALVVDAWGSDADGGSGFLAGTADEAAVGTVRMAAGALTPVALEYRHHSREAHVSLQWASASTPRAAVPSDRLYRVVDLAGLAALGPEFKPTRLEPPASTAVGDGLAAATTGELASFTVVGRDRFGNQRLTGAASVHAVARDADGHVVEADVEDHGDSTYTVSYTPAAPGRYELSVTLAADVTHDDLGLYALEQALAMHHVDGSPFELNVVDGAGTAESTAWGEGLHTVVAGSEAVFYVQARDGDGNPRSMQGSDSFSVTGVEGVVQTYEADGVYSFAYTPTAAGEYEVAVLAAGEPIVGSPWAVVVEPAEVAHALTQLESPDALSVGQPSEISLATFDAYGNPRARGGQQFFLRATGPEELRALVADHGDGTYAGSLEPGFEGTYLVYMEMCSGLGSWSVDWWTSRVHVGTPAFSSLAAVGAAEVPAGYLARLSGYVVPEYSEAHTLTLSLSDGGAWARLFVEDELVVDQWDSSSSSSSSSWEAVVDLVAGQAHEVRMLVWAPSAAVDVRLLWNSDLTQAGEVPAEAVWAASEGVEGSPWFLESS